MIAAVAPAGGAAPAREGGWLTALRHRPYRLLLVLVLLAIIGAWLARGGLYLWARWHERKGRQQAARYEFDAACAHFEKSLRIWGGRGPVHFEAARAARRAGSLDLAEENLRAAQDLMGTSAELQLERLLLTAQNDGLDAVENVLQQYVEKGIEVSLVLESLADSYLQANRLNEAEEAITKLLDHEPNNVSGLYHKGRFLRK